MRSRWPLTPRGTGALALSVVAFIVAHEAKVIELLYLSVLLAAIVAAGVATVYLVPRTERVSRTFSPDIAEAGREVEVTLRVQVRSPLPSAQGRWSERLPAPLTGDASGIFPQTASGTRGDAGSVELRYLVQARRRGIHPIGPLTITSTDPFAVARRRHTIGESSTLTVTPAVFDLSGLGELAGRLGGHRQASRDRLGEGTDNLIPRGYLPGDSMRRIHWRASAHRGELMVRQEEQETSPEAIVVLDRSVRSWSPRAHESPGADEGFERAVSALMSVATLLVSSGFDVRVLDLSGQDLTDTLAADDPAGLDRLAVTLAPLWTSGAVDTGALLAAMAGEVTGPLVVITNAVSPEVAESIAPLVRRSAVPILLAGGAPERDEGDGLSTARAHGWRVTALTSRRTLQESWDDVAGERATDAAR